MSGVFGDTDLGYRECVSYLAASRTVHYGRPYATGTSVQWFKRRRMGPIGRGGSELTSLSAVGQLNPFVRLCVFFQLGYSCESMRR